MAKEIIILQGDHTASDRRTAEGKNTQLAS